MFCKLLFCDSDRWLLLAVGGGNYNGSKIDGGSDSAEIDMGVVVLVIIIMMLMMLVMMVICCDDNKVGGDKSFDCGKDM